MAIRLELVFVAVLCMLAVTAPRHAEAVTCSQVATNLMPCVAYLKGNAALTGNCCSGVTNLNAIANNTPENRKAACQCLKQLANTNSGIKPQLAKDLPSQCNVKIGYVISMDTDCNSLN
ncbi:unnamed protein product [Cuscuta epithymum]|uniref:Non-specific lipid-transfer protein n=1 Tax=Cuscuta epithymum TaxID=186058 RepID=A0AAV0C8I2_9ASTE|nr:unnamed protein product [Cuscuta epithymum]CAH9069211.1 unnamed protein product [Cuscuta epithymum]